MAKGKKEQKTEDENFNFIVRIVNSDIDGQKRTVIGLQSIKGVGKRVAQIVAKKANVDPSMKMGSLPDEKVKEIESLVKSYVEYAPNWAINRQMDYESGADMHLFGNDLDIIQKDDINRMKMIRCYRGIRHEGRHKVRGQRTRSNGRHGLTMGVQKKSVSDFTDGKKVLKQCACYKKEFEYYFCYEYDQETGEINPYFSREPINIAKLNYEAKQTKSIPLF